jgi:hypothetical protein
MGNRNNPNIIGAKTNLRGNENVRSMATSIKTKTPEPNTASVAPPPYTVQSVGTMDAHSFAS